MKKRPGMAHLKKIRSAICATDIVIVKCQSQVAANLLKNSTWVKQKLKQKCFWEAAKMPTSFNVNVLSKKFYQHLHCQND